MKKPTKAALLSAFVFPGVGHFFLKKYMAATVLAGVAAVALYVLATGIVARALEIAETIQRGDVRLDITAISELVARQPAGNEAQLMNIASAVLLMAWLIGIVDAYRVGHMQGQG